MVFIGTDHGTTGISFAISDDDGKLLDVFKLSREDTKSGKVSSIDEISKRCNIDDIKLMILTYAMGDGINRILPLDKVENRGILSIDGAGKVTGGGTSVYEEIEKSNIPTLLIPGLHKNSPSLDKLFNAAYSHQASPEKVSIAYNAIKETGWKNLIVADLSSNSVNILIEDGKIRGAIDACLGAMGFVHGPIDLEMIRNIDEGKISANEAFSHAGAVKTGNIDTNVSFMKDQLLENYKNNDENAVTAIDTITMTIAMEIFGLIGISNNDIEGIVLTGSLGSMKEPFDFQKKLNKYFKNKYPFKIISSDSGAIGAVQIAYDIYHGQDNILGIEVDY